MANDTALFRPVTITFETLDRLTKEKNPSDLIGLYMSYVAIVQWQQTVNIKATTDFMATRLGWDRHKVIRTKKSLEDLGLIVSVARKDSKGKVTGHYIRIMYIITDVVQSGQIPQCGLVHSVESAHTSAANEQLSANNSQSFVQKQKELLLLVNKITGRSFRTLPERGVKKTLDAFTLEEIDSALRALAADDWHREKLKEFKIDYLIRSTTIDKFLDRGKQIERNEFAPENVTVENQDEMVRKRMGLGNATN